MHKTDVFLLVVYGCVYSAGVFKFSLFSMTCTPQNNKLCKASSIYLCLHNTRKLQKSSIFY